MQTMTIGRKEMGAVILIAAFSSFIACTYSLPESRRIAMPDFKAEPSPNPIPGSISMPDFNVAMSKLLACDKKDADLPLSKFNNDSTVVLEDEIETQDIQSTDCDGKVDLRHGPVKSFERFITFRPDSNLAGAINFIQIENLRTCASRLLNASEDQELEPEELENSDGTKVKIPVWGSKVGISGRTDIHLSDLAVSLSGNWPVNVRDGNNIVLVHYFGKCLKYNAKKIEGGDAENCEVAEELGVKQVLIKLNIKRPEVGGVLKIDTCSKKK